MQNYMCTFEDNACVCACVNVKKGVGVSQAKETTTSCHLFL